MRNIQLVLPAGVTLRDTVSGFTVLSYCSLEIFTPPLKAIAESRTASDAVRFRKPDEDRKALGRITVGIDSDRQTSS